MEENLALMESLPTVDIESWFAGCQQRLAVEIKKVPVADLQDWSITTTADGRPEGIAHYTGRLHRITFLQAWEPLRNKWIDRCLLEPIAEGENGIFSMILLAIWEGKYLVQAKGEPGNNTPYRVVLTPTIQASFVNMDMALSGKIPFTELYNDPSCRKLRIVQDGGQFLNKTNEICLLNLNETLQDIPASFYWATLPEIKNFAEKGLVSEFLMQALGMLAF